MNSQGSNGLTGREGFEKQKGRINNIRPNLVGGVRLGAEIRYVKVYEFSRFDKSHHCGGHD